MTRSLRQNPSLRSLKYEAKQILKRHKAEDVRACETLRLHPRFTSSSDKEILTSSVSLQVVQHGLAMEYGFSNWKSLLDGLAEKIDPDLQRTFIEAATQNALATLKALANDHPGLIESAGDKALSAAFRHRGTEDIISFLVSEGACFEDADEEETPLLTAAFMTRPLDSIDRFRMVFEAGIASGATMGNGSPDSHWSHVSLLHAVADSGNIELAELVLQHGGVEVIDAVLHIYNKPRYTALQLCYWRASGQEIHKGLSETLLKHGAYYDAFSASARSDIRRLVELFEQDPRLIEEVHLDGSSPIHWAAGARAVECVEFLVNHIADVDVRGRDKNTPLLVVASYPPETKAGAASSDAAGVVRLLIEKGADVNAQDVKGRTPLHRATFIGNAEVAELLLEAGADPTIENKKNKSAFDVARMGAKYLKQRPVQV